MNIGFDVDGVLTDYYKYQVERGEEFLGRPPENLKGHEVRKIFNCTASERRRFWAHCIWRYFWSEEPREGAAEYVNRLKENGHDIYLITSRAYCAGKNPIGIVFRRMLRRWLKKNGIPYDKICFCDEEIAADDKLRYCLKYKISYMFEDSVSNLMKIKDITNAICFKAPYNEHIDFDNIRMIESFTDILLEENDPVTE